MTNDGPRKCAMGGRRLQKGIFADYIRYETQNAQHKRRIVLR